MKTDLKTGWTSTMSGFKNNKVVTAHSDTNMHFDTNSRFDHVSLNRREDFEEFELFELSKSATFSSLGGKREIFEEPDELRTCFQRDRDRILHASSFRRLAGKTQVFIFPEDNQRTRLTHALEVSQVALSIARVLKLNTTLVEAIALGHDCGHGPGGHASEEAFSLYIKDGYDHATWGADVTLKPLNLCYETLDGIRNHSWSRPSPFTLEGEVVSFADRIAYVCHDFEDAKSCGIVTDDMLKVAIRKRIGLRRSEQISHFINEVIECARETGLIGMREEMAEVLSEFRKFNYDHIYNRPASISQNEKVIKLIQSLTLFYIENPDVIPVKHDLQQSVDLCSPVDPDLIDETLSSPEVLCKNAVSYVAGMTDRFLCDQTIYYLGWRESDLPDKLFK